MSIGDHYFFSRTGNQIGFYNNSGNILAFIHEKISVHLLFVN